MLRSKHYTDILQLSVLENDITSFIHHTVPHSNKGHKSSGYSVHTYATDFPRIVNLWFVTRGLGYKEDINLHFNNSAQYNKQ